MRVDIAVVGAGPSGSWAATLLARQGARVALLDATHPREKPCGGGVTGRALALVGDVIPPVPSVRIVRARFLDARTGLAASVPLADDSTALVVASRRQFDGMLYNAAREAGADAIQVRATSIVRHASGFVIETAGETAGAGETASTGEIADARQTADVRRIETPLVIGADGANSLVRRRLASAFRRDQLSAATGFFAHGVTSDEIVLEMTCNPPGYIWSFPRPDHLAIGICAQADSGVSTEGLRDILRAWIERVGLAKGARLEQYSWPIPSLSARDFATLEIAGPGWMTIGDAAGLVDPITREGIFFALQSASFAAEAIGSGASDPMRVFDERVRDEIVDELARAARYKAGFFRPRFTRLLVDALRSSEDIRAVMADLVAGVQSYRDLKWRLARTREFRLAWRLLTSTD